MHVRKRQYPELWKAYRIQLNILNDKLNKWPPATVAQDHNTSADTAAAGDQPQERSPAELPMDPNIPDLLKEEGDDHDWERLYEAEQRLAYLMNDDFVRAEASRRFVEAERLGVPTAKNIGEEFKAATTDEQRRNYFCILLDDLHFRYTKRRLDRAYRRSAATRLNWFGAGIAAVVIMFFVYLIGFGSCETIVRFHVLILMFCGLVGAYLSRMIAFQKTLASLDYDELLQEYSTWSILIRLVIGVLLALIIYLLIVGGLVGGNLFPQSDFSKSCSSPGACGVDGGVFFTSDMAKALVWSILAGFSERLVPDQLTAIAARSKGADSK